MYILLWRGSYLHIEKVVAVLVGIFSLSVVVGLVLIQGTEFHITSEQVLSGLTLSFGEHDAKLAAIAVVRLLGALRATGNELFMYPYWILEKGYGQHVGSPDDPEWLDCVKGWVRVLQVDVFVCTAAFARMWSDMLISLGWLRSDNDVTKCACQRWVQSIYLVAFLGIALLFGKNPEKMVIFGQYVSGLFTTPLLMVAICWMAFRTDRRVRMGKITVTLLVLSVIVIATCVVVSKFQ